MSHATPCGSPGRNPYTGSLGWGWGPGTHFLLVPLGHCAAVTVGQEPEPCQGGLCAGQLPQDAAHGSDHHAGHDQPCTVPR